MQSAHPTMQSMQHTFNLNMQSIQSHNDYPRYARSETKPVVRARHIINNGSISNHPCSTCVELGQACYRFEGNYSKCAYCTSKDRNKESCHLPGQEASPSSPPLEKRKRRKITKNIYAPSGYAASTADTMMSGTGTLASDLTPFSDLFMRSQAPSPEPSSAMTGTVSQQTIPPTIAIAEAEASSDATLERVTVLENQLSGLQSTVMEMLVKLDEVSSCVSSTSTTPESQAIAAGGASSTTTTTDVPFQLQARHLSNATAAPLATMTRRATMEWVQGPKMPGLPDASSPVEIAAVVKVVEEAKVSPGSKEHTVEHAEGYSPVNCSCTAGS